MKELKLYFDFEFTSLSPDAQPISLGIVADECFYSGDVMDVMDEIMSDSAKGNPLKSEDEYRKQASHTPSWYAEFSDFDINRCDDWVKENVVGKLKYFNHDFPKSDSVKKAFNDDSNNLSDCDYSGVSPWIKSALKEWLTQFSDYQIQFVCDCGTYDWYWMVQLLAEWEEKENCFEYDPSKGIPEIPAGFEPFGPGFVKAGLPKLPTNISPVPEDLNDLIASKLVVPIREAFDMDREELAFYKVNLYEKDEYLAKTVDMKVEKVVPDKHNALWDAKVIKEIYQKLK